MQRTRACAPAVSHQNRNRDVTFGLDFEGVPEITTEFVARLRPGEVQWAVGLMNFPNPVNETNLSNMLKTYESKVHNILMIAPSRSLDSNASSYLHRTGRSKGRPRCGPTPLAQPARYHKTCNTCGDKLNTLACVQVRLYNRTHYSPSL